MNQLFRLSHLSVWLVFRVGSPFPFSDETGHVSETFNLVGCFCFSSSVEAPPPSTDPYFWDVDQGAAQKFATRVFFFYVVTKTSTATATTHEVALVTVKQRRSYRSITPNENRLDHRGEWVSALRNLGPTHDACKNRYNMC